MSASQNETVASLWREDLTRPAGFRRTLKIGNAEYGFCWIPAGEFEMGSLRTEEGRDSDETLHHVVLTRGFWMLETPTTQGLYQEIMGENPSSFEGDDNLPVEFVSWDEAAEFCEELTKRLPQGLTASLPTEAQWEYACRAGTPTFYSFGNALNGEKANCDGRRPYGTETTGKYVGHTTPVKSYAPNPWGLYDMHGNVWEWCLDYYGDYPSGIVTDPKGSDSASARVFRGGGWDDRATTCRAARRNGNWSYYWDEDPDDEGVWYCHMKIQPHYRYEDLGFRFLLSCDDDLDDAEALSKLLYDAEICLNNGDAFSALKKAATVFNARSNEALKLKSRAGEAILTKLLNESEVSFKGDYESALKKAPTVFNAHTNEAFELKRRAQEALRPAASPLWSPSSSREAGFRQTLKIGNAEYGFCWIPAGEFDMGSPETEEERRRYETLHHVVLTRGFWALETPTPQALYQEIMGTNPSYFKRNDLPVESVSWYEATAFCEELTMRLPEGLTAILPTEAQWEYACRAGTTTPYSFGSALNGDKANCYGKYPYGTETTGKYVGHTTPVKSYVPNGWGLYDMHGNVWEWCLDLYCEYPEGIVIDPRGSWSFDDSVIRGGGWDECATTCRSARRDRRSSDYRHEDLGFRFLLSCDDDLDDAEALSQLLNDVKTCLNYGDACSAIKKATPVFNARPYVKRRFEALKLIKRAEKAISSKLLSDGEVSLNQGDCELALRKATTVLEARPDDKAALELKRRVEYAPFVKLLSEGEVSLDKGDYESALGMANAVLNERPEDKAALELKRRAREALRPAASPLWSQSPSREAGTRQTLKIGNAKYGFCWIPAGEFDMGSPETEVDRDDDEILHHVVLTRGFWMLETPTPQSLYQEIMRTNPRYFRGKNLPVETVSWDEAMEFCEELTLRLPKGLTASLPTEAQWEYACRAGTTTPYSFGSALNGDKANCDGNSPYGTKTKGMFLCQTTPVKSYEPNAWGLYDMHGNVWEWCVDYYGDYPTGTVIDPKGPDSASFRVVRGGSWNYDAGDCRSASRYGRSSGRRDSDLGFRFLLVCD